MMARWIYMIADTALNILLFAVLINVLHSWVPSSRSNTFVRYLNMVTEPLLRPFRFARVGMIDLSPMLLFLTIQLIRIYILPLLAFAM